MTVIVTDNCMDCRYTECVAVCPVSCFHQDERMVYIDPVERISCRACLTACSVNAIYDEEDMPPELKRWVAINAERAAQLPRLMEKQPPLPDADKKKFNTDSDRGL